MHSLRVLTAHGFTQEGAMTEIADTLCSEVETVR